MMKRWMFVLVTVVCLNSVHAQDAEAKKKFGMANAAVGAAIAAKDTVALAKVWSPKLIVNSPNNTVLTRDQIFEALKAGKLDYEGGYRFALEKIEFFGDIAVTMGEDTYTPNFGPEKGKLLHRRATNIWQYANGSWLMIARQATIYDPEVKHY